MPVRESHTKTASDPNPKNNSSSVETYALEPPKTVQFSSSNYTVTQACTTLPITVTRRGDASGAASVDYFSDALGVTAAVTINYSHATGRVRFAPGETSKSFPLLITKDGNAGPVSFTGPAFLFQTAVIAAASCCNSRSFGLAGSSGLVNGPSRRPEGSATGLAMRFDPGFAPCS